MNKFQKAIAYIEQGATVKSAAFKFGIPSTNLYRYTKQTGVLSEEQKTIALNKQSKNNVQKLRHQGLSYSKIAKQTGLNETSVKSMCIGIVLNATQTQKNLGKDPEKVKRAIQLRREGKYYFEIATELQSKKNTVFGWIKSFEVETGEDLSGPAQKRKEQESQEQMGFYGLNKQDVIVDYKSGMPIKNIAVKNNVSTYVIKLLVDKQIFSNKEIQQIKQNNMTFNRKQRELKLLKPVGGARPGSGRSKSGYYKEIYCGSTYELCWVIYNLDMGKDVKRFDGYLQCPDEKFKYYPDFIEDNRHIIEIKGYEDESVARKTALAERLGYKLTLMKKEDLKHVFKYVDKTYNVNESNRHSLYDGYKPKYNYMCNQCSINFPSETKRKTKIVFCSNSCSGKFFMEKRRDNGFKSAPPYVCKITDQQAVEIFQLAGTYKEIAEQYHISKALVGLIKNKKVRPNVLKNL